MCCYCQHYPLHLNPHLEDHTQFLSWLLLPGAPPAGGPYTYPPPPPPDDNVDSSVDVDVDGSVDDVDSSIDDVDNGC